MRDMHHNLFAVSAFDSAAISTNTTTNGNIIDMQGFHALEFIMQSATLTDGTYTPLVEAGDASDLSDAIAVADAELLGTEANATFSDNEDDSVKLIGYIGNKRYVRLSFVSTGVTTGGTLAAIAVKAKPGQAPVA